MTLHSKDNSGNLICKAEITSMARLYLIFYVNVEERYEPRNVYFLRKLVFSRFMHLYFNHEDSHTVCSDLSNYF